MKIAHVTAGLCRRSAGLAAAVAGISEATSHFSREVRVFGLSTPDWERGDGEAWCGAPATVFDPAAWSGAIGYAPRMFSALMTFDPDYVHLHGLWNYPSIAVHRWHRETKRPYIISAHGMLYSTSLMYKSWRKFAARRLFQNQVLNSASVLHATATDEKEAYRAAGFRNPIELIPLGIDVQPILKNSRTRRPRRITFLGRLHLQKGIDWLLIAWSKLEKDFPDWELSIVGPEDDTSRLQIEQLKPLMREQRVRLVGPLYGKAKLRHIADSEILVMPSRSENFGLAAAESLMMGVPVIATKGTPWSGLMSTNSGWWIDLGPSSLETAMREAMQLSEHDLRTKGQNGRRWIESDFAMPAIADKWLRLYKRLPPLRVL